MQEHWHQRYHDDKIVEDLAPLNLRRVKVIIELEVMADITDYGSHKIVLCHPTMDGQLSFDVDSLENAEDTLDELENETMEEELVEPEPEPERPKVIAPKPQVSSNPYVTFKSQDYHRDQIREQLREQAQQTQKVEQPKPVQPKPPEPVEIQIKKPGLPVTSVEDNPIVSIVSDVMEIGQLFGELSPKFKRLMDKAKNRK